MGSRAILGRCLALLLFGLLAACGNQDLYGKLDERQANEMIAALRNADIEASKRQSGEGEWSVAVGTDDFSRAVEVLRANGLPRDQFASLGDVFAKEGFVSSPTEERARLIYGLSQELSNTVSQIDGVVEARVHLAIPESGPLGEETKPSSAAVFIKYQPGFDLRSQTGPIKSLVTNSIEGLTYDKVSVVMFASQSAPPSQQASIASIARPPVAIGFGALGLAGLGVVLFRRRRRRALPVPRAPDA